MRKEKPSSVQRLSVVVFVCIVVIFAWNFMMSVPSDRDPGTQQPYKNIWSYFRSQSTRITGDSMGVDPPFGGGSDRDLNFLESQLKKLEAQVAEAEQFTTDNPKRLDPTLQPPPQPAQQSPTQEAPTSPLKRVVTRTVKEYCQQLQLYYRMTTTGTQTVFVDSTPEPVRMDWVRKDCVHAVQNQPTVIYALTHPPDAERGLPPMDDKQWCEHMYDTYRVQPSVSWGKLPTKQWSGWIQRGCDGYVTGRALPPLPAPTPEVLPEPTAEQAADNSVWCLFLFEAYDVRPGSGWGRLPPKFHDEWSNRGCDLLIPKDLIPLDGPLAPVRDTVHIIDGKRPRELD